MNSAGRISTRRIPVDRDCLRFALPLALIAGVGWVTAIGWLWIPATALLLGVIVFFRDPPRRGPSEGGAVWSPADGKIAAIGQNDDPASGPAPGLKITIFLSVLNCHINRAPCAGTVRRIRYQRGKFLNALDPASSEENESNWIFLDSAGGQVVVRQIAGLIARRIVCRAREGDQLGRGQRIGLIRFGSRTELYLPLEAEVRVAVGQRVKGGRTEVAMLNPADRD